MKKKLYVMKNEFGLVKIGISENPDNRAKLISTASGVDVIVMRVYEDDQIPARNIEKRLHELFAEQRKKGEWFDSSVEKEIDDIVNDEIEKDKTRISDLVEKAKSAKSKGKPDPKPLILYLNSLPSTHQEVFARRCGTSVAYLRKASYTGQKIGEVIAIAVERESRGKVRLEDLRPDIDWAYVRGTAK